MKSWGLIPRNQLVSQHGQISVSRDSAPRDTATPAGLIPREPTQDAEARNPTRTPARTKAPEAPLSTVLLWGRDAEAVVDLADALAGGLATTHQIVLDADTTEAGYRDTLATLDGCMGLPRVLTALRFDGPLWFRYHNDAAITPSHTLIVHVQPITPTITSGDPDALDYQGFLRLTGYKHLRVHPDRSAYMDSLFKLACIIYDAMAIDVDSEDEG